MLLVRLSAFPFSFFFFSFTGSAGSTTIASAVVSTLGGADLLPTTVKHVGLPGTWYLATSLASSSNCQTEGTIITARVTEIACSATKQAQGVNSPCWFPYISFSVGYENLIVNQGIVLVDYLLSSCHLSASQCIDTVRRNYTFIHWAA